MAWAHDDRWPGRRVGRTIFVGGESRHVGLCQHVARAIRAPAHVADPLARLVKPGAGACVGVNPDEAQPGWAVAMGLCASPTDL